MTKRNKKTLFIALAIAFVAYCGGRWLFNQPPQISQERAERALRYCRAHGMSENYCVFVDFSRKDSQKRICLYDFRKQKVVQSALCAHGSGGGSTGSNPVFSNAEGSKCTSLGKYRIGGRHQMHNGLPSLLLDGLEASNSNARSRGILVHPFWTVEVASILGTGIFSDRTSWGCFTTSYRAFFALRSKIEAESKPVLLWAYCE